MFQYTLGEEVETFIAGDRGQLHYDVTAAKKQVMGREPTLIPIGPILRRFGGLKLNLLKLAAVDLLQPVLIAKTPHGVPSIPGGIDILIDGNHRVLRASQVGQVFVPAHVLTQIESDSIVVVSGAHRAFAASA